MESFFADKKLALTPDSPLISSGLLDSLGILGLIEFSEEKFQVVFSEDEMDETNFNSIKALSVLIESKLQNV